ncbi:WD repeat- and FYVE domain-containing protein 4 isoform X2 [Melanotaenia boesemani]|uniref:WD repeat- and FYVE domain-containing protein 4 isoform X2 n=1 Tax=Melanotaenia boesemani TaxID=1250792 RepID=UPI001C03E785|nr:WD repeat- and FYVE domain-containing protein 4 isoform X2 [Melanotaenia boesemani]
MASTPVQLSLQDRTVKGERINKETGELSASGELSVSVELKSEKVEGSCGNPELLQVLREQLQELGIHTYSSCDQRTDHVSAEQRDQHLLRVLPLYIQVCEDGGRFEGVDIKGLAALTADTVIHNIHKRLSERPAEKAREEVVQFLRRLNKDTSCETDGGSGWLLLKSLLLLISSTSDILMCIDPELLAALVKCLYLLVCLPAKKESEALEQTFQEPLTQIFLLLCKHPSNVERLVETQELQCLIIGLTSLWDQTSTSWRHQASRILKAVSAVPTSNTVPCLLGKNCIRICIQNLLLIRAEVVSGSLLAEVAVAVFSFVRDTYHLSPDLFIEFDTNNGYKALENIMKCCEDGVAVDEFQPVEEFLSLIASFTFLGKNELKVGLCVTNPQPPGFKFDPPLTKGLAVKNLPAFHLLQASLIRSHDSLLCCQLLRTLQTIWEKDPANFFLLEWTVQSMAQLAACVWRKPAPAQNFFFSMLETVVFKMNYIPHEALRALLGVLKQRWAGTLADGVAGTEFGVVTLKCFHNMTVHSAVLSEALSDWGLLELLLGELRRRAKILRKAGVASSCRKDSQQLPCAEDGERVLTTVMLQIVSTLTLRSIKNTVAVRNLGMVPYIKIFLDENQYRGPTLSILEQLAEINPDEFMSTTIGALCSSTQQELRLKQDLLQSLLRVLESPNSWDAFRRAGGFTGLLSLVIDMEGALSDPLKGDVWKTLGQQQLLDLLLLTLHTLALAVHLHTVNAHHFEVGGLYERLSEALLQLGCFHTESPERENWDEEKGSFSKISEDNPSPGKSFFEFVELAEAFGPPTPSSCSPHPNLPVSLQMCIRLLSYLDQFATGTLSPQEFKLGQEPNDGCGGNGDGDKLHEPTGYEGAYPGPFFALSGPNSVEEKHENSTNTAPLSPTISTETQCSRFTCDQIILHPGAIRVIMTLLPHVFTPEDPQLSMEVQFSLAHHIQAMVKSEQNRQIMCEGGLVSTLLAHCRTMLLAPNHPLHLCVTRILEKLSSQAISYSDFRKFLCLGDPLMCLAYKTSKQLESPAKNPATDDQSTEAAAESSVKKLKRTFSLLQSTTSCGSAIPVHQIISLVSMTAPRTFRPHRVSSSPAFVEFDMSESGYGCLFLPSLATVKGVTADSISTGGIGGECRGFPPTAGLSFACWFQINRFSSACDSHPIRLLSVVRHMSRTEQQYICLSISFSACDGCLVISTEEEAFTYLDMMEPEVSTPTSLPTSLRFRCSSLLVPGQWHHLVVVMAKDMKKSCLMSAYFNGKAVGTGKMKYIQPFPGQYVSMDPTAVIDVYGLIGTPAPWKEHAALVWRVGPSYLFEEALSSEAVGVMYAQGTTYQGNFLALRNMYHDPDADAESPPFRLVPEERISFGINPAISTLTTVAQIREDYNEVDCRLIAKEMGITSRDHSTPVLLTQNISKHLNGTARTIGAALIGHFGVRTFTPCSASNGFLYIGGPAVVLSLVAMAPDDSSLYAAVKVLLSVLETNSAMQQEMIRINGYKLLAFLLKMKSSLVSHRTFQLVLCLSSSLELSCGSGCLQKTPAFQALLCDLEVWQNTPDHLDLSVLNHFAEILNSSSGDARNAAVIHSVGLLPKLLLELSDPAVTFQKAKIISCVITSLLKSHLTSLDISRLGLFLVYTLPPSSHMTESSEVSDDDLSHDMPAESSGPANLIWIRNQILHVLCEVLNSDSLLIKDQKKTVFGSLGNDWFLLFLQAHLHPSTVKLGLVLLTHFLSSPSQQSSFREGVLPGTLIEGMEEPFAIMENLHAHPWSYECPSATCPGFDVLPELLIRLSHLPQVYEALAALLLGEKASHIAEKKVHLDSPLQLLIDSQADTSAQQLCVEAATMLLHLVKVIITQSIFPAEHRSSTDDLWKLQLPASVMQFLCLLHNLRPRDPLWASPTFLHTLAECVYPLEVPEVVCQPCSLDSEDTFSTTRKPVLDFMRILLMDSLLNVCPNTNTHPLILLLEFYPDGSSLEQRQSFLSELVELIMNIIHMLGHEDDNNTHLSSQGCNNQKPEGQMGTFMENVVLFNKTLLQKLYDGTFIADSKTFLDFLADQIMVTLEKGHTQKEKTVSALYSCTNKVLIYFLSQSRHSQDEKEAVIRTLQTLIERWDVVMATYNANVNFITCLLHCLLLIRSGSYPEGFGCLAQKASNRKISPCLLPPKTRHLECFSNGPDTTADDRQLVSLAEACWSKVLSERQHMLEETYKIEISANHTAAANPVSMTNISPLWEEMACKAWLLHIESQKKKVASSSQNKFDVISSALRSVLRKGQESVKAEDFLSYMESHRQRGHIIFENMRTNHLQLRVTEWESVSSQWLNVEAELLRERAVFGPGPGVLLSQDWVQDSAEGPSRTRSRIRRKALRHSKPVLGMLCLGLRSEESKSRNEGDTEPKILCEVGAEVKEDNADGGQCCDRLTFFPALNETNSATEGLPEPFIPEPCSHTQDCPDMRIILQELYPGEKIQAKMCVVMVSSLRVTESLLLFGKDSLFLCEGFTLSPAGDVCCRKHYPSSVKDSFISTMLSKEPSASCRRLLYEDVKEARFMRFLLEDNAIEIFMKNGHSAFLVFLNKNHVSAYKRLSTVVPALKGRAVAEVIANAKKTPVVGKTALVKWQKGEMSNFEYLMHLNTVAGRTYNDLMQYPVFPWVLADYQSEIIDLSNPATFRDLSKPMGAQTEKRKQMFIQRYEEVDNNEDEDLSARCHYCTHYSSAIIVASFLVRMEPFSHTFQTLQGGFDIPERMFYSIKKEWESASRDNMGDVRELIPEFFYLPDFLLNSNHIQLGCMEDGTALGDVKLPPWAKGDPQEFIRIHREALESDYVSSHLHLWIDLIFGFRQHGPAAVESVNTFHPYFYAQRGRRDAKDPIIKSTILGYVSNFGQVPKQLFTKPHPPRSGSKKEGSSPSYPTPFFFKLDKLKISSQPFRELPRGPVGQIICLEKEVLVLEKNRLLMSPLLGCFFSWGFPDNSCVFGNYATEKNFAVSESLCDWGEMLCAACPNPTTIITAGSSAVVCVWDVAVVKDKLTHMKLRQPLYGHTDTVTCLAASEIHSLIVSGSSDLTCILWDMEELSYITQLTGHKTSISALAINELTGEIVSCAGPWFYLWTMKGQMLTCTDTSCGPLADILCVSFTQRHEWDARNVIVTGCADGVIRIWRTEYTRTQLPGPPKEPVSPGHDRTERDGSTSCLSKGWKRRLMLCQELNGGQTASQRHYKNSPAITALGMSRSHATLLAGDAWGKVFTWTCE